MFINRSKFRRCSARGVPLGRSTLVHLGKILATRLAKWPGLLNNLSGVDWACLLAVRPAFADKCAWSKLSGTNVHGVS